MEYDKVNFTPLWTNCLETLPEIGMKVLIICNGVIRLGSLVYQEPVKYWVDPDNNNIMFEWTDITHWMVLPDSPCRIPHAKIIEIAKLSGLMTESGHAKLTLDHQFHTGSLEEFVKLILNSQVSEPTYQFYN